MAAKFNLPQITASTTEFLRHDGTWAVPGGGGGGELQIATANLTAADVVDLFTTAFETVPTQGAGKIIIPNRILFIGIPGNTNTPFDVGDVGNFQLCYTSSGNGDPDFPMVLAQGVAPSTDILTQTDGVRCDYGTLIDPLTGDGFVTLTNYGGGGTPSWALMGELADTPLKLWANLTWTLTAGVDISLRIVTWFTVLDLSDLL